MHTCFGEDCLQLHYKDTESFTISFEPIKGLIESFKHFKEELDLSDVDPTHEVYPKDNEKVLRIMKLETGLGLD